MPRIHWIDLLRGICMIAILLFHTEMYMVGKAIIPYTMYVTNALIIFYFISGYLIYKKNEFKFIHKLKSIGRTMLIPYLLFTSIIGIVKPYVKGQQIDLLQIGENIALGQASWFIAALMIAELLLCITLWITRGKLSWIFCVALICLILSIAFSERNIDFPWQINNALQAVFFLITGYVYHHYEKKIKDINKPLYNILLLIILIIIKRYEYIHHVNMMISPLQIDLYPLFLLDITISIIFMVNICKAKTSKIIEWTGSHSLVYYFLCGGVPLLVSKYWRHTGLTYGGRYWVILLAFIIVYMITTLLTWTIYTYIYSAIKKKINLKYLFEFY